MNNEDNNKEALSRRFIIAVVALVVVLGFTYFLSGLVFGGRETSRTGPSPTGSPEGSPSSDTALNAIPTEDETGDEVICPVCKVTVDPDKAEYSHFFKKTGKTYYFDREKCYLEFLDRPHLYIKGKPTLKIKIKLSPGETGTPDDTKIEDLPTPSATDSPSPDSTDGGNRIRIEDVPLSTTPEPDNRTAPRDGGRPTKSLPPPGKIPYEPPPTFNPPPAMPVPDNSGGTMPEAAPVPKAAPPAAPPAPHDNSGGTVKAPPAMAVPDGKPGNPDDFEIPAGATPPRREKK